MSLTLGLICTPDWQEPTRIALEKTAARVARLSYERMTTSTVANEAFNSIRGRGANACVMFNNGTAASTILSFCQAHAMNEREIVELGNEDSYSYKTSTEQLPTVARNYATYALGVRNLLTERGVRCQIVIQGDPAQRGTTWIDNLYLAVPSIHRYFAGFTVHPYGPREPSGGIEGYRSRLGGMRTQLLNKGAPAETRFYVTEWGISTDNGRSLSENYGWPVNMTYAQASAATVEALRDIKANYTYVWHWMIYQNIDQATTGTSTNRESYFGVLKREFVAKPVAAAIRSFVEESGGASTQTGEARLTGRGTLSGNADVFPNVPILDNFNRVNSTRLGAPWEVGPTVEATEPEIAANFVRPAADGLGPSGALWTASRWADVATFVKKSAEGDVRIYGRMVGPESTGYRVRSQVDGTFSIARVDRGGVGNNIAVFTQIVSPGDYIGMVIRGTTIYAWYRPAAGEWRLIGSARDATYAGPGYVGFLIESTLSGATGVRIDDFGGGAITRQSQTGEAALRGAGSVRAEGTIGRRTVSGEARLIGRGILGAQGRANTTVRAEVRLVGRGTLSAGTRLTTNVTAEARLRGVGAVRGEGTVRLRGTSTPTWSNIFARYGTWQQVATRIAGATTFTRPRP